LTAANIVYLATLGELLSRAFELLEFARGRLDLARRARRWTEEPCVPTDRARLIRYAEELEQNAFQLEQQAIALILYTSIAAEAASGTNEVEPADPMRGAALR
jgi:hypothetical protein